MKPKSPSDTYVIYDQFHFRDQDHVEIPAKGWEYALAVYRFQRTMHPGMSLGLTSIEKYKRLKSQYKTNY